MAEKVLYKTMFADLDEEWSWLREDDTAWKLGEDALCLRSLPGTLWGERNDARNILLRPARAPEEGLFSEVSVTNDPQIQGEQAGLIWYVDDGNYVKLIKECLDGEVWVVMAREEDDQPAVVNKVPVAGDPVRLRLGLRGGKMIGMFVAPGTDAWEMVGTCEPLPAKEIQPGIYAHGGPNDAERWADLRAFQVLIEEA